MYLEIKAIKATKIPLGFVIWVNCLCTLDILGIPSNKHYCLHPTSENERFEFIIQSANGEHLFVYGLFLFGTLCQIGGLSRGFELLLICGTFKLNVTAKGFHDSLHPRKEQQTVPGEERDLRSGATPG